MRFFFAGVQRKWSSRSKNREPRRPAIWLRRPDKSERQAPRLPDDQPARAVPLLPPAPLPMRTLGANPFLLIPQMGKHITGGPVLLQDNGFLPASGRAAHVCGRVRSADVRPAPPSALQPDSSIRSIHTRAFRSVSASSRISSPPLPETARSTSGSVVAFIFGQMQFLESG